MESEAWARVERPLGKVERPVRYIDHEWGAVRERDETYRAVLVYPDTYELGMANQAVAILYDALNSQPGFVAERCFVPWIDMAKEMRSEGVRLSSLESGRQVRDADLLGITLPYELTFTNILETLDLSGIPFRSEDRTEEDPLVVGGGPCAFNPEPVAPFFDAILIGEGESAVIEIVQAHRSHRDGGAGRKEILAALARIPGVYVPSLYEYSPAEEEQRLLPVPGAQEVVLKRAISDLGDYSPPLCPVVPFMDVVHDRVGVEVMRGCTRGCRFCQAGMTYRPVRERRADDVVKDALAALRCTGYDEVSLTSLSTTDHSQLEEILRRLAHRVEGTGVSISVPSMRVDAFSLGVARLIGAGRKTGLTFAPEAGTQRLRDVINKNVTEQDLLDTVSMAFGAGWRRVKLYFMIGLPTETDEDVLGIAKLTSDVLERARASVVKEQRGSVKVGVSVSVFVPKPHTPFQWEGQLPLDEVRRRQELLRSAIPRKGVDLSWHDPEVSFVEAVLSRGGREVARAVEAAWRQGAVFGAWTERFDLGVWSRAFEEAGVEAAEIATIERSRDEHLPWEVVSTGVSRRYLWQERQRAMKGQTTDDCTFRGCTGCDACDALGVDIRLGSGAQVRPGASPGAGGPG